jgi:tetratricopeptide (TPR) repeat protein/tRNA A-37 threonylcarbamoyl transferase component Bud32
MGEIFKARDRYLEREVVMKLMLPGAQADPLRIHRFVEEAQVTGQLEHPNIVPVHDLGVTAEGNLYFTMKLVKGQSLDKVIQAVKRGEPTASRKYPVVQRLGLFRAICNALAFAHARGVIHRDLKPENVMIGEFGEVLVMDWGLAKVIASEGSVHSARAANEADIAQTVAGQVFGTPKYMAPEQARGDNHLVDHLSDIYSLGTILYELLALRQAFKADSIFELMVMVGEGQFVPPGDDEDDPEIPVELRAICLKAMALERNNRYASVEELVSDIEAYLSGYAVSAHQDSPWVAAVKWARRNRAATAAIAAGFLALVLSIAGMASYQHAQRQRLVADLLQLAAKNREQVLKNTATERQPRELLEAAQGYAYQALGLAPDNAAIGKEIHATTVALSELEAEERRQLQLADLVKALDEDLRTAKSLKSPDNDEARRIWYAAWNRTLTTARSLWQEALGEDDQLVTRAKQAVIETAHQLAGRLRDDGNYVIAETMIDEAAAAGLDPTLVEAQRLNLAVARTRWIREQQQTVLELFRSVRDSEPDDATLQAKLAHLAAKGQPHVVALLIPRVFSDNRWERRLAIEALGLIGDRKTQGRLRQRVIYHEHRYTDPNRVTDAMLWALLQRDWQQRRIERAGSAADPARATAEVELDAVDTLILRLLPLELNGNTIEEALLIARALERLGDERATVPLALYRWLAGFHSLFFRRTAAVSAALPPPAAPAASIEDGTTWIVYALVLLAAGDGTNALIAFDRALAAPEAEANPDWWRLRARARLIQGNLAGAQEDAQRTLRMTTLPAARLRAASLLAETRAKSAPQEALADLERTAATDRFEIAEVSLQRARLQSACGNDEAALASYAQALKLDSLQSRAFLERAQILSRARRLEHAHLDLSSALSLEPTLQEALLLRAEIMIEFGFYKDAVDDLDAVIRLDPTAWRAFEARALAHNGQAVHHHIAVAQNNAWHDMNRAIQLNPEAQRARILRSQYAENHSNYMSMAIDLSAVIQQRPRDIELLFRRATAYRFQGDYDLALADLQAILSLQQNHTAALRLRGVLRRAKGQYREAQLDFEQLLAIDANDHLTLFELSRLHFNRGFYPLRDATNEAQMLQGMLQQGGPRDQLIPRLEAIQQLLPTLQETCKQAFQDAVRTISRAIELRPDLPEYLYYRGQFHQQTGNAQALLADFERAAEIADDSWYELDIVLRMLADFNIQQGNQRGQAGDRAGALAAFKKALAAFERMIKTETHHQVRESLEQTATQLRNTIRQLTSR